MKRKVTLVDFKDKDKELIALSKKMTPRERIQLLFELIELSQKFRPANLQNASKVDDLPFIVLKKKIISD